MFRRMGRRLVRRAIINIEMPEFKRARRLMEEGEPNQAAELFEQLAGQQMGLGKIRQAANLHAQAAHAWVDAGDEHRAVKQANAALQLFARLGMLRRPAEFRARFANHLRQKNFIAAAEPFASQTPIPTGQAGVPAAPRRGRLPAECPKCGAPVNGEEVEWLDDFSAECDFCGATLHAEG